MLNADVLNTKEDMISKSNELSYQLVDTQKELSDLYAIRDSLYESLSKIEAKILCYEDKKAAIASDLEDVNLCKRLIYNDLSALGSEFMGSGKLHGAAKTVLVDHGCKIIENEDEKEYKVKRMVLGKLK